MTTTTEPMEPAVQRDEQRLAELLRMLRYVHPNVLVVCPATEADWTLERMRPCLRLPIAFWSPRENPTLPSRPFRTLVVRDADRLEVIEQEHLAALVNQTAGDAQVISMSSGPLFPLVQRGAFLDRLYYQLNVVYVELNDVTTAANRGTREERGDNRSVLVTEKTLRGRLTGRQSRKKEARNALTEFSGPLRNVGRRL